MCSAAQDPAYLPEGQVPMGALHPVPVLFPCVGLLLAHQEVWFVFVLPLWISDLHIFNIIILGMVVHVEGHRTGLSCLVQASVD